MKRSYKKQNYKLFIKYFSEELVKQTGNTLKDGCADLIARDVAYKFNINRPEFWHRPMKHYVEDTLPLIKHECFKENENIYTEIYWGIAKGSELQW